MTTTTTSTARFLCWLAVDPTDAMNVADAMRRRALSVVERLGLQVGLAQRVKGDHAWYFALTGDMRLRDIANALAREFKGYDHTNGQFGAWTLHHATQDLYEASLIAFDNVPDPEPTAIPECPCDVCQDEL